VGRTKSDKEKFGIEGTIFLGKHYVTMGQTVALSNKVYMDMIRSHVVFVCGKRGGGKCLAGDTLITLHDGSRVPIQELAKDDKAIITLDKTLKIRQGEKSAFYKRTVDTMLRLTLRSGKEIKLTPEHPLLTVKGWSEAQSLRTGSRIANPRTMPIFGERHLDEAEIKILAYLIAEGHLGNKIVGFSNNDAAIVDDFTAAVYAFDRSLIVKTRKRGSYDIRMRDYATHKNLPPNERKHPLKTYLAGLELYGKDSYTKFIPQKVFTATKANVALFLNRLFSCDGTIYFDKNKKSWRISYASASRSIIDSLQSLLMRFSILSTSRVKINHLNSKAFKSYELELHAAHIPAFIQEIGFFGEKTRRQREALRDIPAMRNPNMDTIPKEVWELYKPESWTAIGKAAGYAHPKAMRERVNYSPSRNTLHQIAIAETRNIEQEFLLTLAHSDIFWDEIASVKKLHGRFDVYDLTVPETHNFIANDIIVHNSYTMGVIAEGMADMTESIRQNISIIMLDTMGIYWTMKYPNAKEKELCDNWGMTPKPCDITIFCPVGFYKKAKAEGIPVDQPFSIRPSELLGTDWITTFGMDPNSAPGVLIEKTVHELRERLEEQGKQYSIDDILKAVDADKDFDPTSRAFVRNHFIAAQGWGIFSEDGTPLQDLARAGQITVLDLSAYATEENGWAIKSLVTGLVSQKLFIDRMVARKDEEFKQVYRDVNYLAVEDETKKQEMPLVWLVIDEAHEFLPNQGTTLASAPLITILREGRQPGISLILASQQPGKIHTDVMTQSDIIISHRITAKLDTDALGTLMQSYMRTGLDKLLDGLPRTNGAALVLDDNNEKMVPIQIRPRFTWHGGESPVAIKREKQLFEF